MNEQSYILDFDDNPHAVIEPRHDDRPFQFHDKLLYAFVPEEEIKAFLDQHLHRTIGEFHSVSFTPKIYEVQLGNELVTLCQAPLGASAAVQLLDWLIGYGVKEVLTVGTAGVLVDLPENVMLLPKRAIRDEGTSFHYMEPGRFVDLNSDFLDKVERAMKKLDLSYKEVITWTTDGFFRETPKKVNQFKELGVTTIEMECAALAACAQFRKIDFAQILFTADSLADIKKHDNRNWGKESHRTSLEVGMKILTEF